MNGTKEKWRTLIEEMPIGVILVDCDRKIRDINKSAAAMIGREKEEILGRVCHEFVCPVAQNDCPVYDHWKNHGKTLDRVEAVILSKDHGEVTIEKTVTPIVMDGETMLAEMFSDISERKRTEQDIRNLQRYNRELIETSLDPLITFDRKGIILDVNEATIQATGRTREELIGTPFADYFTDPERAYKGAMLTFEIEEVRDYELVMKAGDGTETVVAYNASVYKDQKGLVVGAFAAARDITRQEELEQKLHNAFDKLKASYKELAIPVIQAHDGVLVIPVVGILDDLRVNQLTEAMLHRIADMKSKVVILDLTAVRSIDSAVANRLLETVAAARLLGAECIPTGICPEVAAATVRLGLDESGLVTRGSLQEGLLYALKVTGGLTRE